MRITHTHRFDAALDKVTAMFADREFSRARAAAMGTTVKDVDMDEGEDGSRTIALRAGVPTSSIPHELRPLLGSDLTLTYTEVWEPPSDGEHIGTFAVEIAGAPGHVAGALGLTAVGDATELLATGDVAANVPLFGPMIEKAVAGAVHRAFTAQLDVADAWLAR